MKPELLAWAAGFVDGEGSITVTKTPRNKKFEYSLVFCVSQKMKSPLIRLKSLLGGTIYNHGQREIYEWKLYNQKAINALKLLYPYLLNKKWQAKEAIEYENTFNNKRLSNLDLHKRESIRNHLKFLKRVGI